MAKVTPGYKLYLYQLLSRELGFGKQTLLPQVEEVLAADEIIPADLECATIQELVEACPDFLKVTVFKKGRVYATVLRNEEWNRMLTAPQEKPATKKGSSTGGPKTWKKKKSGKKAFKAVKPGKQRREREAAEAQAAAELAEAERIAAELAEAERAAAKTEAARIAAEAVEAERTAAEVVVERIATELAEAKRGDDGTERIAAGIATTKAQYTTSESTVIQRLSGETTDAEHVVGDADAQRIAVEVSVFENQSAETESAAEEDTTADPASNVDTPEATKEIAKDSVEERMGASADDATGSDSPEQNPETPSAPVDTVTPKDSKAQLNEEAVPITEVAPVAASAVAPSPAATEPIAQTSTSPLAERPAAPKAVTNPAPSPKPTPKPIPAAPEPAPISITITYDPYEDMERELERQRREAPIAPAPKPSRAAANDAPKPTIPLADLPQDFGGEVSCKDALLRTLYQLLPYDADPIAILDEDWRMARSTGNLSGSRHRATFPLRYLHEDGSPISVTLRKTTKNSFGKQWNLTLVDGDDGSGTTHLSVGIEGLPSVDEGAWSDLGGGAGADVSSSPVRTLTQQVVIGTWDSFLGALATTAAPERWNYPGEGVGKASRYGILREYLATTFLRAMRQERITQAADGSFAAFHTGLSTTLGDDIYTCLGKRSGDIPWQFLGFATAGSGDLGARLTGTIAELPEPATYLATLADVMPDHRRLVILDTEAILGRQLGRLPRAFLLERLEHNAEARDILTRGKSLSIDDLTRLARIIKGDASAYRRLRRALDDAVEQAMRAARASYRIAAPVFDPVANKVKLLLPLCLVEDSHTDCALVLDLQPSGAYRAAAILSLPRAYACARVISREQPRWLTAERVL